MSEPLTMSKVHEDFIRSLHRDEGGTATHLLAELDATRAALQKAEAEYLALNKVHLGFVAESIKRLEKAEEALAGERDIGAEIVTNPNPSPLRAIYDDPEFTAEYREELAKDRKRHGLAGEPKGEGATGLGQPKAQSDPT